MNKDRKGYEIVDPFTKDYQELTAARTDAYYKELHEAIFENIPTRARVAIAKGYNEYLKKCTEPFLSLMNPVNWIFPGAALGNTLEVLDNCLRLYVGSTKYLYDLMVSTKLIEKSPIRFRVGENIASTPSEIVHETPLLRLRRYTPTGEAVHQVPILMIYSVINAYYILDLTKELSLIGYFVDNGYDVFVTDWKLITEDTKNSTLEDYISEIVTAKEVIRGITGQKRIGGLGYCIGGTYLDIEAALNGGYSYIINLTTMLNSKVGEEGGGLLGAFSDFAISDIDEFIKKHKGVFPGEVLKSFFDWVKPEKAANMFMDLYFYGREYEYANDAIYFWNTYTARDVAGPAHRQFLWEIYYENSLAEGTMRLFNRDVNLKNLTAPFCNVAALFDHIVPFPNALATAYLIGTPPEKQMTIKVEGGHVRGVVNPTIYPVLNKFMRQYSGHRQRPFSRKSFGYQSPPKSVAQSPVPQSPRQAEAKPRALQR